MNPSSWRDSTSSTTRRATDDEKAAERRAMMPAPMMDRLDEILAMQTDESCYVAEREGQVGILVEREFPSASGGGHPGLRAQEVWGPGFEATEANLFLLLRARFAALAAAHPGIEVYVTGRGSNVRNGHMVLRGFIPVHLATEETVAEPDAATGNPAALLVPRTTSGWKRHGTDRPTLPCIPIQRRGPGAMAPPPHGLHRRRIEP